MKKLISILSMAILISALYGFTKVQKTNSDIFTKPGVQAGEGEDYMIATIIGGSTTQTKKAPPINWKTSAAGGFNEGILFTRISYPGNNLNEWLSKLDFEKGDIPRQLEQLHRTINSDQYSSRVDAQLKTMTEEERTSMSSMTMAMMLTPLYARIYLSANKVLAKAYGLTYSLESFMDTENGRGKMIVEGNNNSSAAAIEFSAVNLRKVWEKEEIDASRYQIKELADEELVAGYLCKKVTYTLKQGRQQSKPLFPKPAYKLTVWYSPKVSGTINFMHPFYFQLDKGILKIVVDYDERGRNKLQYEVTRMESKALESDNFTVTDVKPVINWDTHPEQASLNILSAMMGGMGEK